MKLFTSINIETSALCNRTCVFCPNHGTARPDELMPEELLARMLAELVALNYGGRISWFLYNEPLRDPRLYEILRTYRRALPRACFNINTNGDYIRGTEDIRALFAAGLNQLRINVYSAADASPDSAARARGAEIAARRATQLEEMLQEANIPAGPIDTYINPRGASPRAGEVARKYGVVAGATKLAKFQLQNRSGNVKWFLPSVPEPLAKGCARPFRVMNVNWRGDAVLCCNDYHGEVVAGNVQNTSLVDLWNSRVFNEYRLFLQNKRRDKPLCATCSFNGGAYLHNVSRATFGAEEDARLLAR